MTSATPIRSALSWHDANQACLVAEFARLKEALTPGGNPYSGTAMESDDASGPLPAIDCLTALCGLSAFERGIVLLCAGVEMDSALASLCTQVQGSQRAHATFGLAMAVLTGAHWSALTPTRPLRRLRLLEVQTGQGLASAPLRISERVLHYLAGINALDAGLQSLLRAVPFPEWIAGSHQDAAGRALAYLQSGAATVPIFYFCGDDPQGQEDAASLAAHRAGLRLFAVSAEDLPPAGPDLDHFAQQWEREALLQPAALLLQCGSAGATPAARHLAERLGGVVFLAGRDAVRLNRPMVRLDVDKPAPAEQHQLWDKALGAADAGQGDISERLSGQFRLSARTIHSTSQLALAAAQPGEVWNLCRSLARPRLEDLAQRIEARAGWDDLVLPPTQKQTLRHLAAQARHRLTVCQAWGFSEGGGRGLGTSALFAGESGTGKTLAAEVLARELEIDLYRIDLATVVSKYIGETEKNLRKVFDAAEEGGVLLLFDEADALFGKRSDVKDSHDRYANIEVSYLLQRMEGYQGLAILTSNLKTAIDKAFQRRLRFLIDFPFPDASLREEIWRRAFPSRTPVGRLDHRKLAQLNVAGGNIRNIALNAAFLAADDGRCVEMRHLLHAARLETQKIERPLSDAEVRGWV